ncbi:MAG: hypothetical protein ACRECO_16580 [Xanthobacteraceae bacterium]
MSDVPPNAAASPDAPKPTFWQRWSRWITIAAGVIILLTGLLQLLVSFSLPGCGDKRAVDALHAIFKERKIAIDAISDFKPVTDTSSEKTCQALVKAPGELATIQYRIYWSGWTPQVMITKVDSKPA